MNDSENSRCPTSSEIEHISEWLNQYNISNIRICKALSSILTIVGLLLVGSIGITEERPTFFSLIIGLICFITVFILIRSKNNLIDENNGFSSGEFLIIEGTVSKIETNVDTPGCVNICFFSNDEKINEGWFRVRQENLKVGSPLLLVIPNSKRTKKVSPLVFSEFMLTDEGIKLHW